MKKIPCLFSIFIIIMYAFFTTVNRVETLLPYITFLSQEK